MEKLILNPTEDTPKVVFDFENGIYRISGRSLPENAVAFYLPLIDWLKEFGNSSQTSMVFHFKLDYFNTASAKQITKLLLILQEIAESKNVLIKWHYYSEDYDIKSSGARFAKLIKAKIELEPYED